MRPETPYLIDRGCEQSVPFRLVEVDLDTNHLVIPFMSGHSDCPQSNTQSTTELTTTTYFPLIPISSLVLPVTDSKSETRLGESKAFEPSQQLITTTDGLQFSDVGYFVQTASSSPLTCGPTSSFSSGDSKRELSSRAQNTPPSVSSESCSSPVGSALVRGWKAKMSKNYSSTTFTGSETCINPHIESSYHPYHPNHFWCPLCRISYASSSCPTHPFTEEKDSPVTTFARQSLPQCMQLSETDGSYHVVLNKRQAALTRFGPVIAPTLGESELRAHPEWQPDCPFRLDDLGPDGVSHRIRYLKFGDEDLCNWMMFVRRVDISFSELHSSSELSPNTIAYQQGAEGIFFLTTRLIRCGEELIVAFAPPYAIHCGIYQRSGDEINSSNEQSAEKAGHGPTNLFLPIRPDEIHCFRCSITFHSEDAFRIHCLGHPDELIQRGFVSSYSEAESGANTIDRLRESFIEVCKPNVREDCHPCENPIRRTYFQSTLHCSLCAAEVIGLSQLVHHTNLEHSVARPRIFGPSASPNVSNNESEATTGEVLNSDGVLFAANQVYDASIETGNPPLSTGEEVFVVDLSHVSQNLLDVSLWAYGCGQCGQRFPNILALEQHKESDHVNDNVKRSIQLRSGSSFSSTTELATTEDSGDNGRSFLPEHKLADKCVQGKIVEDSLRYESDASAAQPTSLGEDRLRQKQSRSQTHSVLNRAQFQCPTCRMEVKTRSALAVHMRGHNYESTQRIPSVVVCTSSQLSSSSGTMVEGPKTLSRMRPRLRLASNTGFFTCCVCGESQKNQLTWRMHSLKHRRSSDRRFPCPVCSASSDRAYVTFDQLQRHMRHVHANQIFPCPYCPSTFGRRKNLNNHLTRHTGRRDFVCPYENCQKSYSRKDKLHTHLRTHSEKTWVSNPSQ
ncbi:unnamed protein product [Calicophoron daubneyi]|uniref:C2H2-type domain-containing protein n=1 Tax=Calicophoron daubneyi TaxID=300641 RepID=A0AAV2TCU9_CALDB